MKKILLGTAILLSSVPALAQDVGSEQRRLFTLSGTVHKLARPEFDAGPAPGNLPMDHVLLMLQRTPQQEADLQQLLEQQQDPASAEYHQWLTPEEFGRRFGALQANIDAVSHWLRSHGFTIDNIPAGRTIIEFSGTVATINAALHAEMHAFVVKGKRHWANAKDPEIPAAIAPMVAGIASLNNFELRPQVRLYGTAKLNTKTNRLSDANLGNGTHGLSPGDYAIIYNSKPLLNSGINGTGRTIAVIGRSNINLQDVADFRKLFGLPAKNPTIIVNGTNPGNLGGGEEIEAVLDNTWAGAIAPNATIKFVVSASTNSSDGVHLSELYAINHNVADIMTESFGSCEISSSQSSANYQSSLAQQAAAEGISYMVSSGDSGAAGCDDPTEASETGLLSINVLGSSWYTTTVGGTQFNEGGRTSFWSTSNSTGDVSAKSYIPENVWNQSCSSSACGSNANLYAGGGGVSEYFTKPSWQSSVPGIPNDGFRDVPDVSLTASAGHDPYLLCVEGSCSGGSNLVYLVGGTSASAPSFAGIMALVDQKNGGRQGNANPNLYRLAADQVYSSCNGSNAASLPSSTCVFNDVTVGSNAVPGESGYGTSSGKYRAGTGYDLATGLGSVNATNLANKWSTASGVGSSTYYGIIGAESGRALEVTNSSLSAGATIELWDWAKSLDQQWELIPAGTGYYKIQNRLTGYVMDDAGGSMAANNFVLDNPWTGASQQLWQLSPISGQTYRIINKLSGMSLKAHYGGQANGTLLVQAYWDKLTDCEWTIVAAQ